MSGYGAYIVSGFGVMNELPRPVVTGRDPVQGVDLVAVEGWIYPVGQGWLNSVSGAIWEKNALGTWVEQTAAAGPLLALATGAGTAVPTAAGVVTIAGTANQIASTATGNTVTLALAGPYAPATYTAHGVLIGEGAGPIVATTPGTTGQLLTGATGADPAFSSNVSVPGFVTAGAGNITATDGNLVLGTTGNKLVSTSVGTTPAAGFSSIGSATLVGGTITISTASVTAASLIIIWRQSVGATGANALGMLAVGTITPGTSFVINANTTANATTLVATDVSVVGYFIIN